MLGEHFEKLGIKREKLWPYEGVNLQDFSGIIIHPEGYIELMVALRGGGTQ